MPQYTSTSTSSGGTVVNSVLNTETNTVTITATAPNGLVATTTMAQGGDLADAVVALRNQWTAQDPTGTISRVELSSGIRSAVISTTQDVGKQSTVGAAEAVATGTPSPNEKQPIPVQVADNPSPTPAPTPEPSTSSAPASTQEEFNKNFANSLQGSISYYTQDGVVVQANEAAVAAGIKVGDPAPKETVPITPVEQKTVPDSPTSDPYDELGNLNPGWGLDENGNPVWVKAGYLDATGENIIQPQKQVPENTPQGPAYDDEGNLMPGWSLDENNNPVWVGNNPDGTIFVEPATKASADASRAQAKGLQAKAAETKSQPTAQDAALANAAGDWRVRLTLAPSANYLYKAANPGILAPLKTSNGVIFPYTPSVTVNYQANYDQQELIHSNYKMFQYKSSSIDSIAISCDFTAQDTKEANYLLAVIHFFRSVTKMFYGQDQTPGPGVPPPLCFMHGLGAFQFDNHPLVITNFSYALPTDVDYIRANAVASVPGQNQSGYTDKSNSGSTSGNRLQGSGLQPGAMPPGPQFQTKVSGNVTYVPTKMQIQLTALPIVTRNDISNRFSLRDYATGKLLRGSTEKGGGIW